MPQTFLALGAIALAGLVAFQQQQARAHEQRRAILEEVLVTGRSVGNEVLERLATLPFDAASPTADSTALTPEAEFGLHGAADPLADASDVDDVDGIENVTVTRTLTDPMTGAGHTFNFAIDAEVGYVIQQDSVLARTGGMRTFAKEVVLFVRHPSLAVPLELRRVYTQD